MVMSIELLLTDKITHGVDFLMARLKALRKSKLDGNKHVSKFYELIPPDSLGATLSREDEEFVEKLRAREVKRAKILHDGQPG